MAYHLYQTEGIVLQAYPRGEADMSFRLYTKDYGSLSLFAKGIRLEKSKLRGNLEMFTHAKIAFIAGRELYRLTYAEVLDNFLQIRTDFFRFRMATRVAKLLSELTADEEKDPRLWALVIEAFSTLNSEAYTQEKAPVFFYTFQIKLLDILGYLPEKKPLLAETLFQAENLLLQVEISSKEREELREFLKIIYGHAGRHRSL